MVFATVLIFPAWSVCRHSGRRNNLFFLWLQGVAFWSEMLYINATGGETRLTFAETNAELSKALDILHNSNNDIIARFHPASEAVVRTGRFRAVLL